VLLKVALINILLNEYMMIRIMWWSLSYHTIV